MEFLLKKMILESFIDVFMFAFLYEEEFKDFLEKVNDDETFRMDVEELTKYCKSKRGSGNE